jgi:uncharacterized membrane protein YphA (DoxX/SURF4 family)
MFVVTVILTVLLAVVFTHAGVIKLAGRADMRASAEQLGFSYPTYRRIGALETAAVLGLLVGLRVPAFGLAAAIGLALLMVGAAISHLRHGDGPLISAVPGMLGVLALVYVAFRVASI